MKHYITLLLVIATIAVNGLANALPINGRQTGEISDRFEVFFTPAGYAFSIWGLIYLLILGFAIYQMLPRNRGSELIDKVTVPFWISSIANMAWIVLWHYEQFGITLLVMLALLGSLLLIWSRLYRAGPAHTRAEYVFLRLPFSVYAGWVTIATLANMSVVFEVFDLRPFAIGARSWAIIMIIIGGMLALLVGRYRRDLAFLCVVLWAFIGIAVKQGWQGAVAISALIFVTAVVAQVIWILLTKARSLRLA